MKREYDLSKMKWIRNPYIKYLKRPITIRIDQDIVQYFKDLSEELNQPYQRLMNRALRDYVSHSKKPSADWLEQNKSAT